MKPGEHNPNEHKHAEHRPAEHKQAEHKHAEHKPGGQASGEHVPHNLPKVGSRTLLIVAVVIVLAMVVFFLIGFLPRHARISKREAMARETRNRPLVVLVVHPKSTTQPVELKLPADVRGWASTALYARTDGYLASWSVDIHDRVKKGDVMAVISAPDTDANLEQAVANLKLEKTTYDLAVVTEKRYRGLIPVQGVTQQQLDQYKASVEQAKADLGSLSAAVDRLKTLVGFEKIVAPFGGIVTARNDDVGALISASNIGSGQELYDLVEDDRLRVFVEVPQAYASLIQYGQPVTLTFEQNFPGHRFTGTVARSSGTLDPATRTLRTELDFDNNDPSAHVLPGMYGEAAFELKRSQPAITIPTGALLFEAEGKEVAIVDKDNRISLRKIVPGRDFGVEMEVLSGLKGDERIVANPGEELAEGIKVEPQFENAAKQGGGNGAGQPQARKQGS